MIDQADTASNTPDGGHMIPFPDRFYFFPETWNCYPLLEWQTTIQPGYAMPSGARGTLRIDRTRFFLQDAIAPFYLVWRNVPHELFETATDDAVLEFQLNNEDLSPLAEPKGFGENDIVLDLQPFAALGENQLILRSAASTRPPLVIQDALDLWGEFAVRTVDDLPVLVIPPLQIQPGPWATQGYPAYQGVGVYRQKITLPDTAKGRPIFLGCESVLGEAEICVNGTVVDILRREPWRIEITEALQDGENLFQFRVGPASSHGTQPIIPSGLGPVYLEVF